MIKIREGVPLEELYADSLQRLYEKVLEYQTSQVDDNTKSELDKAESLIESKSATVLDLPKASELALWLEDTLYGNPADTPSADGSYYSRKNHILSGKSGVSLDFSDVGKPSWRFSDIRSERKLFLEGIQ